MGLYCKITIALFYFAFIILFKILKIIKKKKSKKNKFKLISFTRYKRYINLIFTKRVIIYLMLFSFISNTIVLVQNYKYEFLYSNLNNQNINISAIIINKTKDNYIIKVITKKYKNTYLYLNTRQNLDIGNKVNIKGVYKEPQKRRNYKGFDYKNYLKTKKIYGTIKSNTILVLENVKEYNYLKNKNKIYNKIKLQIEKIKLTDNETNILKGIIIGDKSDFSEEIINNFSKSNISHILAISGMHINCIIIIVSFFLNIIIGKHYSKVLTCLFILFYIFVINISPSVIRAGISGILLIMSTFFYKKSDIFESLGQSVLIILVYNPYLILDIGLVFSYISTIGIFTLMPIIKLIINNLIERRKINVLRKNKLIQKKIIKLLETKVGQALIDTLVLSVSVNIVIAPIMLMYFNKINVFSIIICIIASFLAMPIIISGIIAITISFFNIKILMIPIKFLTSLFIGFLLNISELGNKLPLSQINFISISFYWFIIYYLFIFIFFYMVKIKFQKNKDYFQMRILNLFYLFKYKIKSKRKKILVYLLIVIMIFNLFKILPKDLKIYFIDVGQRRFYTNCNTK